MFDGRTVTGAVLVGLGLSLWSAPADGQDWRTLRSSRQSAGEERLRVDLTYGAGRLDVRPGDETDLYRTVLKYDAEAFDPIAEYRDGRLAIGVEGGNNSVKLRNHEAGEMDVVLGRGVPLALELHFGAVQADIELGGLRIERLEIHTGASESELRFSDPNPIRAERLELRLGAAAFRARHLGNANAARIDVEGGVGDVDLDFSGEWRGDMAADISMALGTVTLRLPRNSGVRVEKNTFLTSFDAAGFSRDGDTYLSDGWAGADHQLVIRLSGALGSVDVDWIDG